ncbi:unnamed protein product [Urochloa decumbens]|uniref:Uncharacterized protein n=1 Tax=Urochloa decumbens TaxID=240449 RepID=A0ABC8WRN6_9POAL
MADNHTMELNEVHRWLPPEILQDIGIVKADKLDLTIVEELASRLVRVLGSTRERCQCHYLHYAWAHNTYEHQHPPQPQVYQLDRLVHFTNDNANAQTMKTWSHLGNGRIMDGTINLPRFAQEKQQVVDTVFPSAKQSNRGTGVFLPRTEAYSHMTGQAKTPRTSSVDLKPHYNRQQCKQARAPRTSSVDLKPRYKRQQCQQKQQQQFHIHARALATEHEQQERKMKEANSASHDCSDELGLPHKWIYDAYT